MVAHVVIRRVVPLVVLSAALSLLALSPAPAEEPIAGKKYALLVGINDYEHASLSKLEYAVNDAVELRDVLVKAGYEVVLMTADEAKKKKDKSLEPTKANVEAHLKTLVKKFAKGDTLLIGLAGHGLQFEKDGDSYFCPVDSRPFKDRADTMVSMKWIYEQLNKDAAAGVKLLLVDACRNDPDKGRGRGIDAESLPTPPKGIGVLMSCAAGQRSFERDTYKHGVFFHHVLEGLKGEAKDKKGNVTWDSLRSYVKEQVASDETHQTPEELGTLAGIPPVLIRAGKPPVISEPVVQGTEKLAWNFQENETFYQERTTTTKQVTTVQMMNVSQEQKQTCYFSWTPLKKDEKGNWRLKQRVIGISTSMEMGDNKIEYDSTKSYNPDNSTTAFYKSLVGAEFILTIDARGKVTRIEGVEEFVAQLTKTNPQMGPLLKSIFSEEMLKDEPIFAVLPDKPVGNNDRWQKTSKFDMGPIGTYTNFNTYTYKSKEKDIVRIDVATDQKYEASTKTTEGLPYKILAADLKVKNGQGHVLFDVRKGRVNSVVSSLDLEGTLKIEVGEQTSDVELKQTQETVIKVTDRNPIKK